MKINCIIVDDEPLALEYLSKHILKDERLNLIAKCRNAPMAEEVLKKEKVDLVFLDIQMPGKTGVDLARTLDANTMVIFTTAYEKYAIDGYEVNAIDYLLKPIDFTRFKKASDKAAELTALKATRDGDKFIFVKSEYQNLKIFLKDILYVEGLKDYVKIFITTQAKPILSRQNLKSIETQLPSEGFQRVHKSYIISHNKITSVNKLKIMVREKEIPLGDSYKEDFLKNYFKE